MHAGDGADLFETAVWNQILQRQPEVSNSPTGHQAKLTYSSSNLEVRHATRWAAYAHKGLGALIHGGGPRVQPWEGSCCRGGGEGGLAGGIMMGGAHSSKRRVGAGQQVITDNPIHLHDNHMGSGPWAVGGK
jgi:hypothetical protein